MSAQAVVGQIYTFQVLFLDSNQQPLVLNADPTITIFKFSTNGVKQTLVDASQMQAVAGDVGRYTYSYLIPNILNAGDVVYALKEAPDPAVPGARLVEEEQVWLVSGASSSVSTGLIPRFVKSG